VTYIRDLRARVGRQAVNLVGAAALIQNERGELLLQRRSDTGGWGTPGGLCEQGERLEDTLRREVREKTGLEITASELLTVISGPETFVRLPNGDEFYQYSAVYRVTGWTGEPVPDGSEGTELRFFALADITFPLGPVDTQALKLLRSSQNYFTGTK
jgi:ADP-ribose pyrophosphatase YjhB (NUDIX family)